MANEHPDNWLASYIAASYLEAFAYNTNDEELLQRSTELALRAFDLFDHTTSEDLCLMIEASFHSEKEKGIAYFYAGNFLAYYAEANDIAKELYCLAAQRLYPSHSVLDALLGYVELSLNHDGFPVHMAAEKDETLYSTVVPMIEGYFEHTRGEELPEYHTSLTNALYLDGLVFKCYGFLKEGDAEQALSSANILDSIIEMKVDNAHIHLNSRSNVIEQELLSAHIQAKAYAMLENKEGVETAIKRYIGAITWLYINIKSDYIWEMLHILPSDTYWRSNGIGKEMYELALQYNMADSYDFWFGLDGTWDDMLE